MTPFFFGYGSLVNRATHTYDNAHRATARGWQRAWRYTQHRPVAYLTAIPKQGSEILGLMAEVPGGDWAALDEREFAYDRVGATQHVDHPYDQPHEVSIYAIPEGDFLPPDTGHPVLYSYLSTVVQGFLNEFGQDGVTSFFDTTDGWDAPILDDRNAPRYPRAQSLSRAELALTDSELSRVGARLVEL